MTDPVSERAALAESTIRAFKFNAERAIEKCPLGDHPDTVAYCGKCGWAPALLSVCDDLLRAPAAGEDLAEQLRISKIGHQTTLQALGDVKRELAHYKAGEQPRVEDRDREIAELKQQIKARAQQAASEER